MRLILTLLLVAQLGFAAEPEFPLTADSQPRPDVPKGTMIKDSYTAKDGSVFPGTQRDYQIYLPAGHDKTKPAAFMVFQDGVIYQAPVVFDNLIAKKDIPPLVGIFIKPGVVPPANDNALPRFNRSFEYDSITPTYSQFLIDEFLPAIEAKHGLKLSTDPNQAAISGNSSGGICAFMVAWHRPDRFRRVFTGVGTYVGIHGADQLPVLVRKFEPKPLRVFLQSGTGDNNLYCGDWWMANQMMERSLTWAGYDVNHAWGEGGHNQKHATQIFPDVLRWLWRDWQTNIEVKANRKGESKWKGYEVVGDATRWKLVFEETKSISSLAANVNGDVIALDYDGGGIWKLSDASPRKIASSGRDDHGLGTSQVAFTRDGRLLSTGTSNVNGMSFISDDGSRKPFDASSGLSGWSFCLTHDGWIHMSTGLSKSLVSFPYAETEDQIKETIQMAVPTTIHRLALSPDKSCLYAILDDSHHVWSYRISANHTLDHGQPYVYLECIEDQTIGASGLCVDTNGWLYVATALGIQVCDQAGRVNFIIPTPKQPYDVCFGGKDLSELFIACGDSIYKRPTKAKGVVSGQQAPIKPAAPKL